MSKYLLKLMRDPYEEVAYHKGYILRGFSFKWKPETVLMVVKLTGRLDGHVVGFIEAPTFLDCWSYLGEWLTKTNAPMKLRKDGYA